MALDDFQRFHQRASQKRRPLADITNKPVHKQNTKNNADSSKRQKPTTTVSHMRHHIQSLHNLKQKQGSLSVKQQSSVSLSRLSSSFLHTTSRSENPSYQPRYFQITHDLLERLKDSNAVVAASNSHISSLLNWLKLTSFSFVAKSLVCGANQPATIYEIAKCSRLSPYLFAVKIREKENPIDTKTVMLMNSDARLSLTKGACVQLLDKCSQPVSIGSTPVDTYVTWRYVNSP